MDLLWLMASVHGSFAQCFQVCVRQYIMLNESILSHVSRKAE